MEGLRHGKWVRLAAARFLRDLERAGSAGAPFRFDRVKACDPCEFIEKLPHIEGSWKDAEGRPAPYIILHPSHVFFLVNLFGFRNADGQRRFSTALLAVARKNAKSTLAAAILIYCQCCENEPGAQLITAAMTGQQARVVFNIAKKMVEKTPDLREAFGLEPFANSVAGWFNGSSFKPINAKASTQDGLNPSHTCLDEVHAQKTHDLLNVLQSAAGARANPLWLFTTTEGYETTGPWPELRRFCEQVLDEVYEADHFFGVIYALDEAEPGPDGQKADDEFDEGKWVKANPLIDVNPVLLREIQKAAIDARHMPGRHAEFRTKRVNLRAAAAQTWIDLRKWRLCGGAVDLDQLVGVPCWGGLDLASTRDLSAFRLVWRIMEGELPVWITWGIRWVPSGAVAQRTERGALRYDPWVRAGLIRQTDGDVVDYAVIERDVVEACARFKPVEIGYDRWNATDIVNRLVTQLPTRVVEGRDESIMVEFRQGTKSYHAPMQELERAYISGRLRHGGDPVLQWCAANVTPRYDENMNMAPDRKRSPDKIDDVTALLMGLGRALVAPKEPEYQVLFL